MSIKTKVTAITCNEQLEFDFMEPTYKSRVLDEQEYETWLLSIKDEWNAFFLGKPEGWQDAVSFAIDLYEQCYDDDYGLMTRDYVYGLYVKWAEKEKWVVLSIEEFDTAITSYDSSRDGEDE